MSRELKTRICLEDSRANREASVAGVGGGQRGGDWARDVSRAISICRPPGRLGFF